MFVLILQASLITLISSAILSALIVILADKRQWFLNQHDLIGVQKFHHHPVPHVGGLAVFLSFSLGCYYLPPDIQSILQPILLISLPVFVIGLIEDFSAKISPLWRLIFIFISIGMGFFYLDIGVSSLGFAWMDGWLSYSIIGFAFTLLVVGGAVNSVNVIDGYNGLMSGYAMLVSTAMAIVAYQLGDLLIVQLDLLLIASILGFFLLNFPMGKLFMGDGGAYFIGLMLSMIGLVFVSRHDELSNWFVLLLLMYPMFELLFSIYRRKIIHNTPASEPDPYHLHTLIHKILVKRNPKGNKIMNNSLTAPFLWVLSLVSVIPAIFWFDNKLVLIGWACLFMLVYIFIYRRISNSLCFPKEKSLRT
ncbi:Undecaprenyl-phosphate N-acetylglucosaminyl 1-phosphate transferase [hydrothermal vent metagenome]|uniref:Undecaprenyl-phosphate N-acetylglucosaminyl 1-phosphate transferase n=1 Tax=hydrothermal vent metagenome TaxID=652676 RepID=A0A1W1E4X7_9ZZZZ